MKNKYEVFWVAGERDGEILAAFEKRSDAVAFAYKFSEEHEDEFDPTCGGVGITDPDGDVLMNW